MTTAEAPDYDAWWGAVTREAADTLKDHELWAAVTDVFDTRRATVEAAFSPKYEPAIAHRFIKLIELMNTLRHLCT
jgi:hypothetical protein